MANLDNYGKKQALKLVDEALQCDSKNENEAAYIKYLESVSAITMTLLTNRNADVNYRFSLEQIQKLISTAHQCLDRIYSLSQQLNDEDLKMIDELGSEKSTPIIHPQPDVVAASIIDIPSLQSKSDDPKSNCLSVLETMDWISNEDPVITKTIKSPEDTSPLEKAKKLNESLMLAYQARMSRCTQTNAKINIALELHRRMAENLKIAREQEKVYLQKIQEKKRQRFQEVANKMSDTGGRNKTADFNNKAKLYMEILQYVEEKKWVADIKKRLVQNPKDENLVDMLIRKTLRDGEHPISKWLAKKTKLLFDEMNLLLEKLKSSKQIANDNYKSQNPVKELATETEMKDVNSSSFQETYLSNREEIEIAMEMGAELQTHLKESTKNQRDLAKASIKFVKKLKKESPSSSRLPQVEKQSTVELDNSSLHYESRFDLLEKVTSKINYTLNELVELFVLTFEQLESDSNREQCLVTLETIFFPDIWPKIIVLYEKIYDEDIQSVANSMKQMKNVTLTELEFNNELFSIPDGECQKALQLLNHLATLTVPHEKLKVLVHVFKILCSSSQRKNEDNKTHKIGADDLIPLLNYILIRSKLAELTSECYLLERLINPKNLMGEEGYCLTSLQTALKYIQSCEKKSEMSEPARLETTV